MGMEQESKVGQEGGLGVHRWAVHYGQTDYRTRSSIQHFAIIGIGVFVCPLANKVNSFQHNSL